VLNITINTSGSKRGMMIKSRHLLREMRKSAVGRETLQLIKKCRVNVTLDYEEPTGLQIFLKGMAEPGNFWLPGELLYEGSTRTFVWNTQSVRETAKSIIHEITHAVGHGPGGEFLAPETTIKSEVWARLRAMSHEKKISRSDIRNTICRVKRSYPWLTEWK